jgi:hypothetical protein
MKGEMWFVKVTFLRDMNDFAETISALSIKFKNYLTQGLAQLRGYTVVRLFPIILYINLIDRLVIIDDNDS